MLTSNGCDLLSLQVLRCSRTASKGKIQEFPQPGDGFILIKMSSTESSLSTSLNTNCLTTLKLGINVIHESCEVMSSDTC